MDEIQALTQRINRERKARLKAERLLETKSKTLWAAVAESGRVAEQLQKTVGAQTRELLNTQRAANIGTIVWEVKTDSVYWSEGIYLLFGLDSSTRLLKGKRFLSLVVAEDRAKVFSIIREHERAGYPIGAEAEVEFRIRREDGHVRWIRLVGEISSLESFDSAIVVATAQDVTQIKLVDGQIKHSKSQLQKRLRQLEDTQTVLVKARMEAEKANLTKSRFIAMISHEIRTPINGLLGTLSLLEDSQLDEPQRELLDVAVASGENLRMLLNDVIDFSRLETGKIQLEPSPFSIHKLAQQMIEFWQPQARTRGNDIKLEIAPNVPGSLVGDAGRLAQVLNNLVSNAIKFTRDGLISVQIKHDSEFTSDPAHYSMRIEVVDTGIGIARHDLPHLFKEFSQVVRRSNGRHPSYDYGDTQRGAGLGLAICRSIVNRMDGKIRVSSVLGEGTTFCVCVPFAIATEPEYAKHVGSEFSVLKTVQGAEPRVLLVEDVPANQLVARMHLEKFGCAVDLASDGIDAIAACQQKTYDLILMDVSMPRMNGVDATIQIRNLGGNKNAGTPIIGVTAVAFTSEWDRFIEAGMNEVLSKPLRREILHETIQNVLAAAECLGAHENVAQLPPGLDDQTLRASIKGLSSEQVQEVFGQVCEDLEQHRGNAIAFAKQGRVEDLGRSCHAIKGLAASFGGLALAAVAREIENFVKTNDNERAIAMTLDRVADATGELLVSLQSYAKSPTTGSLHG